MYKTLKNSKFAKIALIILVTMVALLFGFTNKYSGSLTLVPGIGIETVYADDSSDSGGASPLFTPIMKDSALSDWSTYSKGHTGDSNYGDGAGSFWANVNGVGNGLFGLTTGSSSSFGYTSPSSGSDKKSTNAKLTSQSTLYMKVLTDSGLDHSTQGGDVSNAMTNIGRIIGGALIMLPLLFISIADLLFTGALKLADYLNFYKYFADGSRPTNGLLAPIYDVIHNLYTGLTDLGLTITALILIIAIALYALGLHDLNNGRKLFGIFGRVFVRIFAFVAGPIVLSLVFASALDNLSGAYSTANKPTSVVMSNIVDFKGWTNHSRLALPSSLDGKFTADNASSNHDVTPSEVLDINTAGAGHGSGDDSGNDAYAFVWGWMSGSTIDSGTYMSRFQQIANDDYFTGKDHKTLKGADDKDVKGLVLSGGLHVSDKKFTNSGYSPTASQSETYYSANGFGLSTVGMYNYLASTSQGGSLNWTNLGSLSNKVSMPSHYSYGFAGRGLNFFGNYLSVLVTLWAMAAMAIIFALRAFSAIFKGFFSTLVRTFTTAGSGSPIQLSKLLADFLSMVVQLYGGAFLYNVATTIIIALNNNHSMLTGTVLSSKLLSAGLGDLAQEILAAVVTIFAVVFIIKYSKTFNAGVDEFLTQGIDRLMGKAGYESGTAKRNQGGLTSGQGGSGTGGGINNDGLASDSKRLTNPDGMLGKLWNSGQDAKDAMDNAENQTKAGRLGALAKHKLGKAGMNALSEAGGEGFANDMSNIAHAKRREGGGKKTDLQNEDADNVEANQSKSADDIDTDDPILGGAGVEGEGDGSMDDLVDAQNLTDDEKNAGVVPALKLDEDGNPTRESVAKQIAATNHLARDAKPGAHMSAEERANVMKKAGIKKPTNSDEANDVVQKADDDLRTAQVALANAKTPEEIKSASEVMKKASRTLTAVQDEAASMNGQIESELAPGTSVATAGAHATALLDADESREKATETLANTGATVISLQETGAKHSMNGDLNKKASLANHRLETLEKVVPKAPKSNPDILSAQVTQDLAQKRLLQKAPSKIQIQHQQAEHKVSEARRAYMAKPTQANQALYEKASSNLKAIDNSIIEKLITTEPNSKEAVAYSKAKATVGSAEFVAKSQGVFQKQNPIVEDARIQAGSLQRAQALSGLTSNQKKIYTNSLNTQARMVNQVATSTKAIQKMQVSARNENFAPQAVGTNGKIADKALLKKMVVDHRQNVKEARTGTIGSVKIAKDLAGMSNKDANRYAGSLSSKQLKMVSRASSSGVVSVQDPVVQHARKAITTQAVSQKYYGENSIDEMHTYSNKISKLVDEFKAVQNNKDLEPVAKKTALTNLRAERSDLREQMGATNFEMLKLGKNRAKLETDYNKVVENARNGHIVNIRQKMHFKK